MLTKNPQGLEGSIKSPEPIAGFHLAANNLVINRTNSQSGVTYTLLMSTNLTLPLSRWTPVATNVGNGRGNSPVSFTNAINPAPGQRFFLWPAK